jgi:hypothetical protein
MLMLDAGRFICIVGGSEIFAQVKQLFQIGCSTVTLLKVLSIEPGAGGGSTLDAVFILTDDREGSLSELPGEFMELIFRLVDIHATGSGRVRDTGREVETTHLEERQTRGAILTCRLKSLLIYRQLRNDLHTDRREKFP